MTLKFPSDRANRAIFPELILYLYVLHYM